MPIYHVPWETVLICCPIVTVPTGMHDIYGNGLTIYIPLAVWVKLETVNGPKVTFDPPNLLLEHQMVEPGVKFPCLGVRCCDLHSLLPPAQHHLWGVGNTRYCVRNAMHVVVLVGHSCLPSPQHREPRRLRQLSKVAGLYADIINGSYIHKAYTSVNIAASNSYETTLYNGPNGT